jgi:hypothetical protein
MFNKQTPRYVYLIESNTEGIYQYKLGVAKDPKQRLKQHKTSNPNITGIIENFYSNWPYKVEAALKSRYQHCSVDGEWYSLQQEEVNQFLKLCQQTETNIKFIYENSTIDYS